jgi:hypothetical protein
VLAQIPGVVIRAEPLALEWSAPRAPSRERHPRSKRTTAKTSPRDRAGS